MAEYDSVIPPGGSGHIVAKIRTNRIQGRRTKSISVETNDPAHKRVKLKISFLSQAPVEVYPQPTANLYALAGHPAEITLVFHRPDGKPLEIKDVVSSRTGVTVKVEKVTEKNADPPGKRYGAVAGDWRVHLALDKTDHARSERGVLQVATNHPERASMSLPMRITIRPSLVAQPDRLNIQTKQVPGPLRRRITVRNNERKAFSIEGIKVEGDLPGLKAEVKMDRPAGVQPVEVSIDPKSLAPGVHRGHLVITTNIETQSRLEVPVSITIKP